MFDRAAIKSHAKASFQSQYGISVGAFALVTLISLALSGFSSFPRNLGDIFAWGALPRFSALQPVLSLASLFVIPPLIVGYASFCLRINKSETGDISSMFTAGFSDYIRNLGGILWMYLFTVLWTLLFIIPGIVKAIAYSMTPYILTDCPKVSPTEALKLSMRMTQGHKGGIFVMYLSFIGWWLLSGLTLGILGLLYVGPYFATSIAGLYADLKQKALDSGAIRPEELA